MRRRRVVALGAAVVLAALLGGELASRVAAESASDPLSPAAGWLDAGEFHSCTVLAGGTLRCWGLGSSGELGYGTTSNVGDVNTPASAGPVNFGPGVTVTAIGAGAFHTCAILNDGSVRCWGFGGDGRLGYGNTNNVLDPSTVGPVDLGTGRTAIAISAGEAHTCAVLDNGSVLCWGFGGDGFPVGDGRLGYGNTKNVGDTPATTPGTVGPVELGTGRSAVAISAGDRHTCVILTDGSVLCWGYDGYGQLGYGNTNNVGDAPSDTPATVGPVNLGGHKAVAISAGGEHTCAVLDDGSVSCWGWNADGQLGYGNRSNVGDTSTDTPNLVGTVNLGGHRAVAISAGDRHTCAVLDDGTVRCWGLAAYGRLGYPTLDSLGNQPNNFAPSTAPVDIGAGRTAIAISSGGEHTCALLDDHSVRCWGYGIYGQLGYCNTNSVGETNTPGSVGPVNLAPGDGGVVCPTLAAPPSAIAPVTSPPGTPASGNPPADPLAVALRAQALRATALRRCLAGAARQPRRQRARAKRGCLRRYGRAPGAITGLVASTLGKHAIELDFTAPGTDGNHPPPARGYLIKQSRHPIRSAGQFARAQTLCEGDCGFAVTHVGDRVSLAVTGLKAYATHYYEIAARDNVSGRCGPRSRTVKATTGVVPPNHISGGGNHGAPATPPPLRNHRAGPCRTLN